MNTTIRRIAVSGSAAVALLGGAAAITIAAPSPASAATQTVAHRAVTAPVALPDGRTVRIAGMGGYGHPATGDHVATVAAFRSEGTGTQLQTPYSTGQVPAGYNQQVQTQSAGGAIGVGVTTIALLGIVVFYKVRHGGLKVSDAVIGGLFGIALSGTVIGAMGQQLTTSLVGSLGTMLGGLG